MKHFKEGLFLLPALGVCLAAVVGFQLNIPIFPPITYPEAIVEAAEPETETEAAEEVIQAEGNYEDGVYRGVGTGFAGDITVEVTVQEHQITDIRVLDYQDDQAFFKRAEALIEKIIQAQTWEVDVVSGATYSSRGIIEAVKNALTGSTEKSEPAASTEGQAEPSGTVYEGDGVWKDGTYHGVGRGYGGNIGVDVTISEQKMTDIQVTDHSGETPSYYEKATEIIGRILAAQNPNVDTVSGATYSSGGIREAVIGALIQASGDGSTQQIPQEEKQEPEPETEKDKEPKKENPKGTPKDGVYEGSARCEVFGYTISLKAKFRDGKAVSISGLKVTDNEDENNEAYWKMAWRPMVKRILKKQSGQVDVVSGATYSSNAIADAYLDAYGKAVQANGGKVTEKPKEDTETPKDDTKTPEEPMEDTEVPKPSGTVKDGTYTVSAVCTPDDKKAFSEYTLTADVTFAGGKLTSISNFKSSDESNRNYYLKAANGNKLYKGVTAQLIEKQSAAGINAVSGATCSSKTIRKLYLLALGEATGEEQTEPEEEMKQPEREPATETETEAETETEVSDPAAIKDGTYRITVTVKDIYEEFWDYDLTADVVFFGGKLKDILNLTVSDETNWGYCEEAANGTGASKGIISQLLEKQSSKVDVISGATCSSNALIELYIKALEQAKQ